MGLFRTQKAAPLKSSGVPRRRADTGVFVIPYNTRNYTLIGRLKKIIPDDSNLA
jgi:hypothetical protein